MTSENFIIASRYTPEIFSKVILEVVDALNSGAALHESEDRYGNATAKIDVQGKFVTSASFYPVDPFDWEHPDSIESHPVTELTINGKVTMSVNFNPKKISLLETLTTPEAVAHFFFDGHKLTIEGDYLNAVHDVIYGDSHSDYLLGMGGSDIIHGGGGSDEIRGATGIPSWKGDKADYLFGERGNDEIRGANGDDRIDGGPGHDLLYGDGGKDRFIFHNFGKSSLDIIADFKHVNDRIDLDHKIFVGLDEGHLERDEFQIVHDLDASSDKIDRDDRIIFDADASTVYYDRDGSGDRYKAVEFVVVDASFVRIGDFHVI